jgi:hypothetical protein
MAFRLRLSEYVAGGYASAKPQATMGLLMRFWIREIAGWLLVLLGLYVFWIVLSITLTNPPLYISAGPLTVIGIFIFRGGIHLLKVAVAARICMKAPALASSRPAEADTTRPRGTTTNWYETV